MYQQHVFTINSTITALLAFAGATLTLPAPAADDTLIDPRLHCTLPTNCVNSRSSHGLAPLRFAGTGTQGLAVLQTTLASFPEATVKQQDESTITAVFKTPAGFRDNVIFLLDVQQQQIDFRSQSAFGLYDFGKNRSRMQAVTARFAEAVAAAAASR
ncbi:MAG: hypothetical protein NVSMB6_16080 [Burkholderiaceae bacterium]